MHTIKLNVPDILYPEIMSLLKRYPNANILEDSVNPDFIISNMDEAKKRIELARNLQKSEFKEEEKFWNEIDEHISKI